VNLYLAADPEFKPSACIAYTEWIFGYVVPDLRVNQSTESTASTACFPICNLSATAGGAVGRGKATQARAPSRA